MLNDQVCLSELENSLWKFAEMSYHVELKTGRCLPYREIPEHWLSRLSTVEEVGAANNSAEQSSVIV